MSSPQCCSNPPILNSSSGEGHVEKLGVLDSYVSGSPNSKLAVILVSDIFGYEPPQFRELADKIAAAGFFVVVPDFFHGDPYPNDDFSGDKGFEEAKPLIDDLKSRGFSAIGAAGFCWGAKVVIDLAKFDNFIRAAALLHPALVTADDFKEVKVPVAVLGAEIDISAPPELVKQFEEVLNVKPEIGSFVKIYPGTEHGWTLRYDVTDEAAVKHAEESHKDLLEWFTKHVK